MKPIIAGPCSAESEDQILNIAHFLTTETEVKILRAGVWKPRTRPGEFEGFGERALDWLKRAKAEYGLRIAVEIATPEHVEKCLKAGIDTLWVGARTSVNPFSMQELAEALQGMNLPVMIKNPINPDLALWIGAIERIEKAGIKDISAIHRGFSSFQKTQFRNPPMWEIPIELKRQRPDIPIFCDPSHISGTTELIPMIAQKGLDLDMDGLMIEVHNNPSKALTDKHQQLNFNQFKELVNNLVEKKTTCSDHTELDQLRTLIDDLDDELLTMIAKRMDIVKKMGDYKHRHQITILQMDRWKALIENRLNISRHRGLDDDFTLKLLQIIHAEAIRLQEKEKTKVMP